MSMNPLRSCLALLLLASLGGSSAARASQVYRQSPGSFSVATVLYDWTDASRDRKVPVKIYYPRTGKGPFPVVVFSHGLGGSRETYGYLGRHWASYGYVSVHPQHLGSDDAVWRGNGQPGRSMVEAAADPRNARDRALDVRFVLDRLAALNREASPLKGRLDLNAIGMAGHSFGSWTTLAVAGEAFGPLGRISLADPRVRAGIAMSSPVPRRGADFDQAFGPIKIPILHMTGTLDDSPISDTKAEERRTPFDHIRGADQYLVTFQGGDHMIFSGRFAGAQKRQKDELFQDLIRQGTTAFWDAYLKGDAKAKSWLARGGYEAELGKDGKLEEKLR
jgi:predicted dienelactone hydrolase